MKLSKFVMVILMALGSVSNTYAEVKDDNIDYQLVKNEDESYASTVKIGEGVNVKENINLGYVGGVYVNQVAEVVDQTKLHDVTIEMTGGYVAKLAAGNFRAQPVSGDVNIKISGGEVGELYGGNFLNTHLNSDYISSATIDSVNITVDGGARVGCIYGGSHVGTDGGGYDQSYIDKYTTTGGVKIDIEDDANVGTAACAWNYCDKVNGDVALSVKGGTVYWAMLNGYGTVTGDATLTLNGGYTTYAYGMAGGSVGGNLRVACDGGNAGNLHAVTSGVAEKDVEVVVNKGEVGYMAAVTDGEVKGKLSVTTNGGDIGTVAAVTGGDGYAGKVCGDVNVTINDGRVSNVYAINSGIAQRNLNLDINGGHISDTACAASVGYVQGDVTVTMKGGSAKNLYAANIATVGGKTTVHLLGGTVTDYLYGGDATKIGGIRTLYVGSEFQAYIGEVGFVYGFDRIVVNKNSSLSISAGNIFNTKEMAITLSAANLKQAALKGAYAAIGADGLTLNIVFDGPAASGKYIVAEVDSFSMGRAVSTSNAPEGWENVVVTGDVSIDDMGWEGTTLYLTYRALGIDAAVMSNWGVFKSSQAFVSTLWGARDNQVSLDGPSAADGKGNILSTAAEAKNIAWGSVYGMSGRISNDGADYSLYGMAIGVERKLSKSSSIGLALGYDWGKVSPFTTSSVDQESVHLALYGRVGEWKAGKGAVAVDWSAAVGDTTSEHCDYRGDWSQTSWQLDARATYSRAINERTTASAFVGMQYYTHDSATADGVRVSGMENLRFQVGGGVSRNVSERTSVYGEASLYFDAMRDNPYASSNGAKFEGTNPGRVGGKIGVGASYSINDKWSARGGYSFDVAEDSVEHNVNVGASYTF